MQAIYGFVGIILAYIACEFNPSQFWHVCSNQHELYYISARKDPAFSGEELSRNVSIPKP